MGEKDCRNILVRGVNWIGDAVMTMPALRALRAARPDAKITLLVRPWVSPLFEKDPNIDEILLYSDEFQGMRGKLRLAAEIRKRKFCEAILFQNALDAALITFLGGVPERVGYSRDARRFLLTRAVPFDEHAGNIHHIEYYLHLLRSSGVDAGESSPWIYLSLSERLEAREKLGGLKRPVVALNPGAAYGSSKRWYPERFGEVARMVIDELGGSVVIFGGSGERQIAGEILESVASGGGTENYQSESRLMSFAGETGLRDLCALISECDVLVTNDSGPMHVGYAVGTPLVSIFGSTSSELTGPVGDGGIVIRKDAECAPCFERECPSGDLRCMDLITVPDVFESVKKLLPRNRAVFFDRDGTLCRDVHYLKSMDEVEMFPEIKGLSRLKENGYLLIGITNQSGIARGIVDEGFVMKFNEIFMDQYGFDGFYYCPHHPDEKCSCRKPEPGLLVRARNDFSIDLKRSVVVGDKDPDMLLAKSVGAVGILVKTGQDMSSAHADFTARHLGEAIDIIAGMGLE